MATEAEIAAQTAATGRDWDQACQAWCYWICVWFGYSAGSQPSALDAYYASDIQSSDVWSAPKGSFIYLDIGAYGHVVYVVDSGSGMASSHVEIVWGINAGSADLGYYIAQTGAVPLGWSWDNAGSTCPFESAVDAPPPPPKGEQDVQYWQYAATGDIAALDNVHMEYRFLDKQEVMALDNLVKAGLTKVAVFSDPAWSDTLLKFREIKTPIE